jgi:hypothetical protein
MGKVMSFRGTHASRAEDTKTDTPVPLPTSVSNTLRVASTVLATGERLPLLVDAATWAPRSMACAGSCTTAGTAAPNPPCGAT